MEAIAHCGVPDRKHTSSLGEAVLLLHAADPLLQDGRDLGWRGLRVGGIVSDGAGEGRGAGLVVRKNRQYLVSAEGSSPSSQRSSPIPSTKLRSGANGIGARF